MSKNKNFHGSNKAFLPSRSSVQNDSKLSNLLDFYPNSDETLWLRSCEEEIMEPIEGKISGIIPQWLNGSLFRNGPGSIKFGEDECNHLFDSSALLHKFCIKDEKVTYQCRFLQSEAYKRNREANRIVISEFGTRSAPDPCQTIFRRISSFFYAELSDNANISLYPFGDELYAFNETPFIHKIDRGTLETVERISLRNYISILHHTSHPHVINDGTVYNLALTLYPSGPHHTIVCFPSTQQGNKTMFKGAHIAASIPARWALNPSYMHTFGITANYYIIIEQPLCISFAGILAAKWKNEPPASCLKWYHDEYTKINVISRATGKLCQEFYAKAFFYLHIINQFEKDDYVILDVCSYKDPSMLNCMYIEALKSMKYNPDYADMFRSRPVRYVLPINPESRTETNGNVIKLNQTESRAVYLEYGNLLVEPEEIGDIGCETPRINYDNYLGKPYRYFYAISSDVDLEKTGCLIKVDTLDKSYKIWWEDKCFASEPIFIPAPNSKEEDDGIVLSAMLWGGIDANRVGLLVLDAKTFTELGRAEFRTPGPVPKCLHGWFLPQK